MHRSPAGPIGAIYCIGRNYAAHARELGHTVPTEPVVFLKSPAAVRGLSPAPVAFDEELHHEVELVLAVGQPVPLGGDPGWSAVRHVALGLDLTRRPVQRQLKERGLPWTTSKSFAGSAVLGPWVATSELGELGALSFELAVGGQLRQEGHLAHMIFDVPTLLRSLARYHPLRPGDLVFTGTPEGVGPIRVGDRFSLCLRGAVERRWQGQL